MGTPALAGALGVLLFLQLGPLFPAVGAVLATVTSGLCSGAITAAPWTGMVPGDKAALAIVVCLVFAKLLPDPTANSH